MYVYSNLNWWVTISCQTSSLADSLSHICPYAKLLAHQALPLCKAVGTPGTALMQSCWHTRHCPYAKLLAHQALPLCKAVGTPGTALMQSCWHTRHCPYAKLLAHQALPLCKAVGTPGTALMQSCWHTRHCPYAKLLAHQALPLCKAVGTPGTALMQSCWHTRHCPYAKLLAHQALPGILWERRNCISVKEGLPFFFHTQLFSFTVMGSVSNGNEIRNFTSSLASTTALSHITRGSHFVNC